MTTAFKERAAARRWQRQHDAHAPRPGDLAPDFELPDAVEDAAIRLSDLWQHGPVALTFGSFT